MQEALKEAEKAHELGEVPVGAVITRRNEVIARGYNCMELTGDPTAHAEILAIRRAAEKLAGWRLEGCTMYVTLEPCPMCAGALIQARVKMLVFGAYDARAGAVGSVVNLVEDKRFNHRLEVVAGILEEECVLLLKDFFAGLR